MSTKRTEHEKEQKKRRRMAIKENKQKKVGGDS